MRLALLSVLLMMLTQARAGYAVELTQYVLGQTTVGTCSIDLRHDELRTFWKDDEGRPFGNFKSLQQWLRARGKTLVCATNAGIYDENQRPLGLYIEGGRVLHKLNVRKNAFGNFYLQPNGVFLTAGSTSQIIATDRFAPHADEPLGQAGFATQSGPILIADKVINGIFSTSSENRLVRNAVCVKSPHEVVLAATSTPVSFFEFSRILLVRLGCVDALFLDGKISKLYPLNDADFGVSYGPMLGVVRNDPSPASR